jgi:uncharacterized protein DUF5330
MFFLLRLAFWLGLVLVLLPREKTVQSEKVPQIGASDAVQAATAAVSDVSQFCKRQPGACEVGGQAATIIGQRAQDGARKLYRIITDKPEQTSPEKRDQAPHDKRPPEHTGSIDGMTRPDARQSEARSLDTLTPDDLMIVWRGVP